MDAETTVELPETETDIQSDSSNEDEQTRLANLPKDFAGRVATKIVVTNESEPDSAVAAKKVAALVHRNLNTKALQSKFVSVIGTLLGNKNTSKYAASTLIALLWYIDEHPEYKKVIERFVDHVFKGHLTQDKPPWKRDKPSWKSSEKGGIFSYYAFLIGEIFIKMVELDSNLYEHLTTIFRMIIEKEMAFNLEREEERENIQKGKISKRKKPRINIVTTKKLYDDIVNYIAFRGEFKSDNLNQKNPNEHVAELATKMRSTRQHIIQNIMNRHALDKKKKLERELKEREARAEEIINIEEPFNYGLYLYWVEKRYNFDYLAIEKIRITLEVIGMVAGVIMIGLGILNIGTITVLEGGIVCLMMMLFSRFICSRQFFAPFYPKDVAEELEQSVSVFTPVFRKMSQTQITSFMGKQVKSTVNSHLLHLMLEYVKYIFAVIPESSELLMNTDEVDECIEQLELTIVKFQRTR